MEECIHGACLGCDRDGTPSRVSSDENDLMTRLIVSDKTAWHGARTRQLCVALPGIAADTESVLQIEVLESRF